MKTFQFEHLYKSFVGDIGETVVLRRVSGDDAGDYTVRARIFDATVLNPNTQVSQTKRVAVILAADVVSSGFPTPFIPKQDRIIIGRSSMNALSWGAGNNVTYGDSSVSFSGGLINAVITSVDETSRRVNGVLMAYNIEIAGA
jgi:hypothetical protein